MEGVCVGSVCIDEEVTVFLAKGRDTDVLLFPQRNILTIVIPEWLFPETSGAITI